MEEGVIAWYVPDIVPIERFPYFEFEIGSFAYR